jgi:RNA polymerase sigma-70 factor, ECF subfamily
MENPSTCNVPAHWLEHKDALRAFIRKRVSDPCATDDLLQEVLLKMYRYCSAPHKRVQNVRSWLFRIAQNTIIDHRRAAKPHVSSDSYDWVAEESENSAYREASEYIVPMIQFLPQEYAEPLQLADIEGLKHQEVAARLGLSLSAAKSRVQRARQHLMRQFLECSVFETDENGRLVEFDIRKDCRSLQAYKRSLQRYKSRPAETKNTVERARPLNYIHNAKKYRL